MMTIFNYTELMFYKSIRITGSGGGRAMSLLRFARKTPKTRRSGGFLPCKLRKQPENHGFYGFSTKNHKTCKRRQGWPISGKQAAGASTGYRIFCRARARFFTFNIRRRRAFRKRWKKSGNGTI
jgi:hypothetical protein